LWLIKLFELEISALRAAVQCGVSYPTALKAYDLLRYSKLVSPQDAQDFMGGEIEMDESYFGGRRKGKRGRGRGVACKVPVFGILERNGIVRVRGGQRCHGPSAAGDDDPNRPAWLDYLYGQVQEL
jgi:transposase